MEPIFLAAIASIVAYVILVTLIPAHILQGSSSYTRHMLHRLQREAAARQGMALPTGAAVQEDPADNPLVRAFLLMPGMQSAVPVIQKAGLWKSLDKFVLAFLLIFLFMLLVFARFGVVGVPLALAATWMIGFMYLRRRISKRRRAFLALFPDALDSIVRSVKAGYPLNAAIAVVGDNTEAPVGPEFKRVADETAYGWTLFEALNRLAERIEEPDVRFFTIVLSVQQESGGNLSEVLTNLSSVLRKRKQLRLKILALSSEGRATAWILGSLPLFVFCILYFFSPAHLQPLFDTRMGNMLLLGVVGMVGTGMLIVRQMINIDI